jgi:hypothetical protein
VANFAYKGRDGGGKLIEGVLEGASSGGVADVLFGRGITPISITETSARAKSGDHGGLTFFKPKVEHIDILLFSRQIHTLLKAGVPIMRALTGLQESATNPAMKEVIRDVRESLEAGRELSVSLARHPKIFNPFYISMVRVGEATGLLDEIFLRLFDHLEFERFMREQVIGPALPDVRGDSHGGCHYRCQPVRHPRFRQGISRLWCGVAADDATFARLLQFHGGLVAGHAGGYCRSCLCISNLGGNSGRAHAMGSHAAAFSDCRKDCPQGRHGPLCPQLRTRYA